MHVKVVMVSRFYSVQIINVTLRVPTFFPKRVKKQFLICLTNIQFIFIYRFTFFFFLFCLIFRCFNNHCSTHLAFCLQEYL